jgi:hypothetical protein
VSVEPVITEDASAPAPTGDVVDASAADAGAAEEAAERMAACRRCCDDEDTRCSIACQQERGCLIRCGSRRVACRSRCPAAPPPCHDLDAGS